MENQTLETKIVSLKELWDLFLQRVWIMLIAAVAAIALMFLFIKITFVPQYESTATIYILSNTEFNPNNVNSSFSLASLVVEDCNYILKSHAVLDEVSSLMKEDPTFGDEEYLYEKLEKSIKTNNPQDSRILEVTVTADSPEEAKSIVDKICDVGGDKIKETMKLDQLNIIEYGTLEEEPCNVTGITTYLLVGLVAAVLVYVIFLLVYIFDDRVRDDESVEQYLKLTILGDIPDADDTKKFHKGYYYRKSYGRYGRRYGRSYGGRSVYGHLSNETTEGATKDE